MLCTRTTSPVSRRVDHVAVADVDADVVDRAAEEHQVAARQLARRDVGADVELRLRRVRQGHAGGRPGIGGQTRSSRTRPARRPPTSYGAPSSRYAAATATAALDEGGPALPHGAGRAPEGEPLPEPTAGPAARPELPALEPCRGMLAGWRRFALPPERVMQRVGRPPCWAASCSAAALAAAASAAAFRAAASGGCRCLLAARRAAAACSAFALASAIRASRAFSAAIASSRCWRIDQGVDDRLVPGDLGEDDRLGRRQCGSLGRCRRRRSGRPPSARPPGRTARQQRRAGSSSGCRRSCSAPPSTRRARRHRSGWPSARRDRRRSRTPGPRSRRPAAAARHAGALPAASDRSAAAWFSLACASAIWPSR